MDQDAETPEYRVEEGDYFTTWRDLSGRDLDRLEERDVRITDVKTMEVAGNFTWGIVVIETDAGVRGIGEFQRVVPEVIEEQIDLLVGDAAGRRESHGASGV